MKNLTAVLSVALTLAATLAQGGEVAPTEIAAAPVAPLVPPAALAPLLPLEPTELTAPVEPVKPSASGASAPAALASQAAEEQPPHVYVGDAECDTKERVQLRAVDGRPDHFELRYRKANYLMVTEPTTTGAVRLHDIRTGFIWIQIPTTSMLLDARKGQRVATDCRFAEQVEHNATYRPDPAAALGIAQSEIQ